MIRRIAGIGVGLVLGAMASNAGPVVYPWPWPYQVACGPYTYARVRCVVIDTRTGEKVRTF